MERHEYRDYRFWETLNEKDFVIVSGFNYIAMKHFIDLMRGERSLEKYAYACGMSTSSLYRMASRDKKKPLQYEQLKALYENRDPSCKVEFRHLFAANGMMLMEDVQELQQKLLKESSNDMKIESCMVKDKKEAILEERQKKACAKLKALINEMRGVRDYAAYAAECGIAKGTIFHVVNKRRRTTLSEKQLKALYDHRVPQCPVTMEDLQKANRLFPSKSKESELDEMAASSAPEKTPVPERQLPVPDHITYDVYLEDMAFYLLGKPLDQVQKVRSKCETLYHNKKLVWLLHDYHAAAENEWKERVDSVQKFFEDKALLNFPENTSLSMKE